MKKHLILLSAALLTLPFLSGCIEDIEPGTEQEFQIETSTEATEPPPKKTIVEIDPFEGIDFTYHHAEGGHVEEKNNSYRFKLPEEITANGKTVSIQELSDISAKGLKKCRDLGCRLKIFREVLDDRLQEGDTVRLRLSLQNDGISEADIPAHVEQEYGIRLKQTIKEITVHFDEDPVKDIDPFEEGTVRFSRDFKPDEKLADCTGSLRARRNNVRLEYAPSLVEGKDLENLYAGDKIKYTVVLKEDGKEYKGEEVNQYLEAQWKRVRLTQTEKEFVVMPDDQNHRYSENVNVMLKRPADWKESVADKTKFSKYDLRNIDGSTATIPITAELFRQFCGVEDDKLEYYIDHNTTGPAYENLILGKKDKTLLFVTEPSEEERKLAADNNVELDVTPIALDGFVFITHKDNPVDSLTVQQIQAIYSGQFTNWQQVGGNDEEIVAYQREANSGSQTVMENMVMKGIQMTEPPKLPVAATMGALVDSVASYRNKTCSLGYSFYYYINNLYQNADIKVLKINGISPDNENLINKTYPFSSGYFAVTKKGGDQKAEEIKQYLLTDEGQALIKAAGYCPVK